ncbi:MAG: hypothetical protein DME07_07040 [Candidatus Rokuibacteriota bacterium]|nr:MAG: hypothetical protein DME07_07040 [Candidatus Rokubacteria bacterium]
MTSTASTFASLMLAVMVIGVAATADSQDRAPAPVVEGQDQKPSTPLESQENTAALPESQEKTPGPTAPSPDKASEPGGKQDQKSVVASEVVVYASDLSERALFEFDFWPSRGSPGGKMVGTIQTGDEMHPPPEEDPHVTFKVKVLGGVPYRCWIRMLVGEPLGLSQANRLYVQFSNAVDRAGKDVFRPNTASYLTVQGPPRRGWRWLPCEADPKSTDSLIYFRDSREITIKVQAGMEGVGFDQFVLSPARFLEKPPAEAIVKK